MIRKLIVVCVTCCLLSAAVAWSADEEQLAEPSLADRFLLVAQDGILLAHGDFSQARFFALGGGVEWGRLGRPDFFENTDRTLFLMYRDTAAFYVCHFNAAGWKTQREERFVPSSIERVSAATFRATAFRYEDGDDGGMFRITETWLGAVVERTVLWKLTDSQKEPWDAVGIGGGGSFGYKCKAGRGGPLPEWSQITQAQRANSLCVFQRNNYQEGRRRFQIGEVARDNQRVGLSDGPAFDFDFSVSQETIHYFKWNGAEADSLAVLLSAMEAKTENGKFTPYYRWFLFTEAGARCDEPFEKQWQGRALLRLYTPVEK